MVLGQVSRIPECRRPLNKTSPVSCHVLAHNFSHAIHRLCVWMGRCLDIVAIQHQQAGLVGRAVGVNVAVIRPGLFAVALQAVHGAGSVCSAQASLALRHGRVPLEGLGLEEKVGGDRHVDVFGGHNQLAQILPEAPVQSIRGSPIEEVGRGVRSDAASHGLEVAKVEVVLVRNAGIAGNDGDDIGQELTLRLGASLEFKIVECRVIKAGRRRLSGEDTGIETSRVGVRVCSAGLPLEGGEDLDHPVLQSAQGPSGAQPGRGASARVGRCSAGRVLARHDTWPRPWTGCPRIQGESWVWLKS